MTQEEKDLLLKDLCARLPFNVLVECSINSGESVDLFLNTSHINEFVNDSLIIKPYLRLLSSMTEEEKTELFQLMGNGTDIQRIDFYISHHFDYRGLIEMGLALEAPEGMYN